MVMEEPLIPKDDTATRSVRPMSAQHRPPAKFNGLTITQRKKILDKKRQSE